MSVSRVAIVYEDRVRQDTTGFHCHRALENIIPTRHIRPDQVSDPTSDGVDLYVVIDDGLVSELPPSCRPRVLWAIDTHLSFHRLEALAADTDYLFSAQKDGAARFQRAGFSAHWLPLAADPKIHRPQTALKTYDWAFVGSPFLGERDRLLHILKARFPRNFVGNRYFHEMAAIYSQSRVVFNRSVRNDVNMRVFEALACGGLLVTNDLADNGQAELFRDGVHLSTYRGDEELFDRVEWALSHPDVSHRIAMTGRHAVLERHTYLHRMLRLLEFAERQQSRVSSSISSAKQENPSWISAIVVSRERQQNIQQIVTYILAQREIADITIVNRGSGTQITFDHPRVRVVNTTHVCGACAIPPALAVAQHETLFIQDDGCVVHNFAELVGVFRTSPGRVVVNAAIDDLANRKSLLPGDQETLSYELGVLLPRRLVATEAVCFCGNRKGDMTGGESAPRVRIALEEQRIRPLIADVTYLSAPNVADAASPGRTPMEDNKGMGTNTHNLTRSIEAASSGTSFATSGLHADGAAAPTGGRKSLGEGPIPQKCRAYFGWERPDVLKMIPGNSRRVLELGCGEGLLGAALKRRQMCEVVGVERDSRSAEGASQRLDVVIKGDLESALFELSPSEFDAVVCADVLEHLRDPTRVLRRCREMLSRDGCLICSIPNAQHHSVISGLLDGNLTYEPAGLLDDDHLRLFTRREIEKLFFRSGFRIAAWHAVPGSGWANWERSGRPEEVKIGGVSIRMSIPNRAEDFYAYQFLCRAEPEPPKAYPLTSIILITHNEHHYTRQCIESVRFLTDEPYELIVVDNGSTDGTVEDILKQHDVRLISNPENRGFPAAANQGIRAAKGERILLLNNDTIVTTGWLRRMLDAMDRDSRIGLVGPVSNSVSGLQQVPVSYRDLSSLDGFAWERGKAQAKCILDTERLVGFCLLIRRDVFDAVGLLDERFGLGTYEDDDFCRRAHENGYRCVVALDSFVHHFCGRTFHGAGIDLHHVMEVNRRKYLEKWSPTPNRLGDSVGSGSSRTRPRLSLCMIVRDNERTIRACLGSIRPWVDEIVVVDTGSADATPRICEEYGAIVYEWAWRDDFAAARNESLNHATGEWIFWMDSDDTIPPHCGLELRRLVDREHPEHLLGYVMQVHCPGKEDGGTADMTIVDHVKLFRNRPELRFEHRIHEQILPAIRRSGGNIAFTDLFVVHSGVDQSPEGRVRKLQRDFRILSLDLNDRPDHPFVLFNLGMTHADCGQHKEAIDCLIRCLQVSGSNESHVRKAYALLASSYSRIGRKDDARVALQRGRALFPTDKELLFRAAMLAHESGHLADAVSLYHAVLRPDSDRHFVSVDSGLGGYKARHNLAIVYEELGQYSSAKAEWEAILSTHRHYPPAIVGIATAERFVSSG